eukprot:gnl/TRDRNA2_/TRDRNA2_187845_c0_seq1.p2 gnl/TRDRNA2_/TRDRNA2_187845_c0~~gnl/TRDRNA2_/TRDRNA2_187845_c0_seq1.p2  ORF type:complete len:120 (-),score=30.54 gnl/TRDRNA2_/TRDRNA2_187845_c0_seq1:56-415(-)
MQQHPAPDGPLADRIAEMEAEARRLQDDLNEVLRGLADMKSHSLLQSAEQTSGDKQSDKMRKEMADVLRQQTEVLQAAGREVQAFPRRWARFELNTSQRKSLMLNIKARRQCEEQTLGP